METVPPATPSYRNRDVHALHSQKARLGHLSEVSASVRKLLRATLIVKRETSITGELWAAFTAEGAAPTLAEIANFSRAAPTNLEEQSADLRNRMSLHGTFQTCRNVKLESIMRFKAD